jgi:hypothetical protein
MKRLRQIPTLLAWAALCAWAAAPAENWVVRTFTDKEGYLTAIFRGTEVRPEGKNISVTDLNITILSGDAASRVETILLAPVATFYPKENRATGDKSVRIVRDDLEATGQAWEYDQAAKRVVIEGDVRIVFNAELKDLIK